MVLSKNLAEALNAQVNAEMWSSNLYLSMAVYFMGKGLNGFAHWMKKQAAEELEHADKMIDYAMDRGGEVKIAQVDAVPTTWADPVAAFENVYQHECKVSAMIDNLMNIAEADKDHASRDFLFGFVHEQVEEESSAKSILDQLNNYGEHHLAIMDHALGKR